MSAFPTSLVELGRSVPNAGYFKRSPASWQHGLLGKEWFHVTLHGPGFDAIVNFSQVQEARQGGGTTELAQVGCLVREQAFSGEIQRIAASRVALGRGGQALTFGASRVQLRDDGIDMQVSLRGGQFELDLEVGLSAVTLPIRVSNLSLGDEAYMHWQVTPRLLANGWLQVAGNRYRLSDAPAYHDHNWGRFSWSSDFSWEWGYALPVERENPWSVVFVRLLDRAHLNDLMQGLFVWHTERPRRLFRAGDVQVCHEGLLRKERVLKLPRVMSLVHPGQASDVPRRLLVRAARGEDRVCLEFLPDDVAAVVVPDETGLGFTVIYEVSGRVFVEGRVDGASVQIAGRSIFEFLGA